MRMLKKILASVLLSMSMAAYAADIPVDAKLDYNQGIDFYKLGILMLIIIWEPC